MAGHDLNKRVAQRMQQPENSDRLRILVDKKKGILTKSKEFADNKFSSLVVQEVAKNCMLVDFLKIHDYNYI